MPKARSVGFAIVGSIAATLLACSGANTGEGEYALRLGEVIDTVNGAGFGISQPFLDAQSCTTEVECAVAADSLVAEFKKYNPILREQIRVLEGLDAPAKYTRFQSLYIEQLGLRIEAGELIIDGWESFNETLLNDGFEKFRQSQAKFGQILDELESIRGN